MQVNQLTKYYRTKPVLKDLTCQLNQDELVLLVGSNGQGKTTLLNAIMQFMPYQKGQVLIEGQELARADLAQYVAYVPDKLSINPKLTLMEAFDFMALFYPNFAYERAIKWSDQLNLKLNQALNTLSKGNQAKVNMLLGICQDTPYLLLDEPLSGLDLLAKEQVISLIKQVMYESRGILITTHEVNEIEHLVDRVIVMQDGQIGLEFIPDEVREQDQLSVSQKIKEVIES